MRNHVNTRQPVSRGSTMASVEDTRALKPTHTACTNVMAHHPVHAGRDTSSYMMMACCSILASWMPFSSFSQPFCVWQSSASSAFLQAQHAAQHVLINTQLCMWQSWKCLQHPIIAITGNNAAVSSQVKVLVRRSVRCNSAVTHQNPSAELPWSCRSDTQYSLSSAVQACTTSLAAVT